MNADVKEIRGFTLFLRVRDSDDFDELWEYYKREFFDFFAIISSGEGLLISVIGSFVVIPTDDRHIFLTKKNNEVLILEVYDDLSFTMRSCKENECKQVLIRDFMIEEALVNKAIKKLNQWAE